jgi:cytochrome c oxidase assembly factor CtaG
VRFPIATILTVGLMIGAIVFAGLGFGKAGDTRVAPAMISIYLFVSAMFFAAQFGHGIRRPERWQRIVAVISILAALFVLAMAVAFYQVLSQVHMPF